MTACGTPIPSAHSNATRNATMRRARLALFLILVACRPVAEKYVIDGRTPYGWVVIDSDRKECLPLPTTFYERVVHVPPSRYVCTSSAVLVDTTWHRYFLRGRSDGHRRLEVGQMIFRAGRIQTSRKSGWPCDADAIVFFYGPRSATSGGPDSVLERARPECHRLVLRAQ
jgi:hypothetical protein